MPFSPGPASSIRGLKSALALSTRGGSRVPELGTLGSVRGALSNERPYRDLRNVVANYPFETSRGFPGSKPNSGPGDHSRLSCGAGDTQLGAGFCRDLSASGRDDVCTWCRPTGETLITLSPPWRRRIVARIFSCSSVGLLCPSTKRVFRQSALFLAPSYTIMTCWPMARLRRPLLLLSS